MTPPGYAESRDTEPPDWCPKWGKLGHNWLQGGYAWWRDWAHLRPWRWWHVCTGCGCEQYRDGRIRRPGHHYSDGKEGPE